MPDNNYCVTHHRIAEAQTGGIKTEADNFDDGFSLTDAKSRVIELVWEAIADSSFAEIVVELSGKQGHVIKFGPSGNELESLSNEDL